MFDRRPEPDVLVVGAGPVGLFTALHLKRRGLEPRVVDEEWRTATHSYALALHPEALRLLEEEGALTRVLEQSYRVRTVGVYDRERKRAEVKLTELPEDFSFVAVSRQDVLESILEEKLTEAGVRIDWNHRILTPREAGEHVDVPVQKLTKGAAGYAIAHTEWLVKSEAIWNVPFVVGCDGHRSLVRRGMDIEFAEASPPLFVAVFEFQTDFELDHELRVVLDDGSTSVMWPMPGGYCRWSFELPDTEVDLSSRVKGRLAVQLGGEHYPVLGLAKLHEFLRERAPWFDGSVGDVRWRMAVRFENRLATALGRGRQWLAGDSAHMTGPIGAQSMNVGLREGRDLAEHLAGIQREGWSLDTLAEYERNRREEWRFLLGLEGGLSDAGNADPWLVSRAQRLLPCIPASGADLAALAAQLGLSASHVPAGA